MQFDCPNSKSKVRQSARIFRLDFEFDFESVSDDLHSFYIDTSGSRSSRGVVSQSEFEMKYFDEIRKLTLEIIC